MMIDSLLRKFIIEGGFTIKWSNLADNK
jgi:hypothetical protein